MKAFGVAVAIANAVLSVINFVNDFKDGASEKTKILDGIIMGAGVLEVVGLAFAVSMPYLAPIAAVIGIVAVLVSLFSPEKPKNPLDDFKKDVVEPFLASLPSPDDGHEAEEGENAANAVNSPSLFVRGVALHAQPAAAAAPATAVEGENRPSVYARALFKS